MKSTKEKQMKKPVESRSNEWEFPLCGSNRLGLTRVVLKFDWEPTEKEAMEAFPDATRFLTQTALYCFTPKV